MIDVACKIPLKYIKMHKKVFWINDASLMWFCLNKKTSKFKLGLPSKVIDKFKTIWDGTWPKTGKICILCKILNELCMTEQYWLKKSCELNSRFLFVCLILFLIYNKNRFYSQKRAKW